MRSKKLNTSFPLHEFIGIIHVLLRWSKITKYKLFYKRRCKDKVNGGKLNKCVHIRQVCWFGVISHEL